MDMLAFLLIFISLALVVAFTFLLKGTVLDVFHLKSNPWPIIWYVDLILVLLPLPVVAYYGSDNIPVLFAAKSGIEGEVAVFTLLTLTLYTGMLGLLLRLLGLRVIRDRGTFSLSTISALEKWGLGLSVYGTAAIIAFYALGYRHAVIDTLLSGKSLLEVRLANAYASNIPSQLAPILPLSGYLLAALGGYVARQRRLSGIFFLFMSLVMLSAQGDKAPVVWGIIIWFLSEATLLPKKFFSLRIVFFVSASLVIAFPILYWLVKIQSQDPEFTLGDFGYYLFGRLGVGQMAGVYETFGLFALDTFPRGEYYWHMLPGASFFVDYLDYQKVLMMVTEGYDVTEMGVKNTYFIAEAFAIGEALGIGGAIFMLFSPIFVAFSTSYGLFFLIKIAEKLLSKMEVDEVQIARGIALLVYLKTHSITGGFSSFPLFKGLILTVFQLLLIWLPTWGIVKSVDVLKISVKRGPKAWK